MKGYWLLIALGIGLLLGWFFFRPGGSGSGTTVTYDTLKVYSDTGKHIVNIPKPYPVYQDTGSIEYIEYDIDSAKIFQAYVALHKQLYTRNIYDDTLKNDTAALIALRDTVFANMLMGRSLTYQNRTPVYYITKTVTMASTPLNHQLSIGADLNYNKGNLGYDIGLIYQNKGVAYRYAYNPLVGEHSFGVYARLWPRSRSPAK